MASDAPLRSAGLPSPTEVTSLLEPEFARAGYVIEDVTVVASARPQRVVVVADPDDEHDGLDLDSVAELARSASALLDEHDSASADDTPYDLEITSRGVDRPLTARRHYRRAQGRKIEFTLTDGSRLDGRLGALHGDAVDVVVPEGGRGRLGVRKLPLDQVSKAVVQVEFSPPNPHEIELAGQFGEEPGR
ncbi:ribosome maturation factor RimP [Mycolicibacterium sediminis]|uniref:Ribosome maturation factor RimP n=1 Tax=Mycolicibacterium sediminis TaxID=1286180 RepID=A0A7I7QSW9_9MYCO|nr:ribosome maturation factor RimP [Mycolicibacterium sediminis]BBY29391.1 ribosome maturation factor RimP [Mycolicibacterium sediminis]